MDIETVFATDAVRRPRIRPARSAASVVIIAERRGRTIWVLLVDNPTKYGFNLYGNRMRRIGFPGGKAEYGEMPQQTATREVFEETNLSIDLTSTASEQLCNLEIVDNYFPRRLHEFVVFSTFDFRGKIVPGENIERVFWVPVQDLLNRSNLLENHMAGLKIFARKYA